MPRSKQITVWVESTLGQLGRIAKALGDAKVNITAFSATTAGGESPIRLHVSSPAKARKALQRLGIRVTEEEVLRITLPDKPGVLGTLGERLGKAKVNIEYAFGSVVKGGRKADVVLGVSELAGAAKALRNL